jgi:hypothetical protein
MNLRPIDHNGHVPDADLDDVEPGSLEYWKARSRQHEHMVRSMKRQQHATSPERLLEILTKAQELAYVLAESIGVSREELDERAQEMREA